MDEAYFEVCLISLAFRIKKIVQRFRMRTDLKNLSGIRLQKSEAVVARKHTNVKNKQLEEAEACCIENGKYIMAILL